MCTFAVVNHKLVHLCIKALYYAIMFQFSINFFSSMCVQFKVKVHGMYQSHKHINSFNYTLLSFFLLANF